MPAATTNPTSSRRRPASKDPAVGVQLEAEAIVALEVLQAELEETKAELAATKAELAEERNLDRCISIRDAAPKVGVSHDYLYKHKHDLPYVLPMGSRWVVDLRKLRECKDNGGLLFEQKTKPGMSLRTANNRRRRSSRTWH